MAKITFTDTKLDGLKVVTPYYVEDSRGYFMKCYEREIFREAGIETEIAETFESFSKKGVLRGLHFQPGDCAQAKLVRVFSGEVYDVCVDLRADSRTFGLWAGEYLSSSNHKALYIPRGFAHGFLVTGEYALMSYTCSGAYQPREESGIRYNDLDLRISWPVGNMGVIRSSRDSSLPTFREYCFKAGIRMPAGEG